MSSTTSLPLSPQPRPPEKRELAAATAWISRHATPASFSAASTAWRQSCVTDLSSNLPQGCIPRPMTATSLMASLPHRPELPGDDLVAVGVVAERVEDERDARPRLHAPRVVGLDAGEDTEPVRQIDDADRVGRVRLVEARRRRRRVVLDGAAPERAVWPEGGVGHARRVAVRV